MSFPWKAPKMKDNQAGQQLQYVHTMFGSIGNKKQPKKGHYADGKYKTTHPYGPPAPRKQLLYAEYEDSESSDDEEEAYEEDKECDDDEAYEEDKKCDGKEAYEEEPPAPDGAQQKKGNKKPAEHSKQPPEQQEPPPNTKKEPKMDKPPSSQQPKATSPKPPASEDPPRKQHPHQGRARCPPQHDEGDYYAPAQRRQPPTHQGASHGYDRYGRVRRRPEPAPPARASYPAHETYHKHHVRYGGRGYDGGGGEYTVGHRDQYLEYSHYHGRY